LRERQGLASPTIERYTIAARQFLERRFSTGAVDLRTVAANDIVEFIRSQVAHLTPPGLKCVVTAMRSSLRFGQYRGDVACELVAAVPAVATWATTPALPRAISPDHAQRAIDSCDLGTPIGLRDRAILLILARLGLRANEVITLHLSDCDWNRGQVRVRSKGGRECLLPIPDDVGSAIAAYLERGRPRSDDHHLFLRSTAPISGFMPGSDAIGSIVKYALARAGVNSPHRGSHQFRHALAVRMLRGGASFAEIGEVLRHRSPQTTSIYARVDIEALRPLALPWPGGVQ
jgi:site-specific recombinase XerD